MAKKDHEEPFDGAQEPPQGYDGPDDAQEPAEESAGSAAEDDLTGRIEGPPSPEAQQRRTGAPEAEAAAHQGPFTWV